MQYFDDGTAYLTQSGQLYNEANAMALGRVYCFGPTFRAEKSKTRRHLTEFWMVEPEVAYANLEDVIELAQGLVVSVIKRVLETRQRELKVLERDTTKLERIGSLGCDVFVDDLPEFLAEPGFPTHPRKVLFDPAGACADDPSYRRARSWTDITAFVLDRASREEAAA